MVDSPEKRLIAVRGFKYGELLLLLLLLFFFFFGGGGGGFGGWAPLRRSKHKRIHTPFFQVNSVDHEY